MEEWRPIPLPELESYLVSSEGRVARIVFLSNHKGYKSLEIRRGSPGKYERGYRVHRLVALTFIGPPPEPHYQVNHKNFEPGDNRPENLEWVRPEDNRNRDAHLTEDEVREIVALRRKIPQREIAKRFGVSYGLIGAIHSGRAWKHISPPPESRHPNQMGSNNGNAQLTEDQVREIKKARGLIRGIELAERYSVSPAAISAIWRGQNWSWLSDAPPPAPPLSQKGSNNPQAKLTDGDVEAIRGAKGKTAVKLLAERYHVSPSTISMILSGKRWNT